MVLVDQTITYLEMTSPDQLLAGRAPPAEVTIDSVDATALALIRSTHDRIATPHHWSSLDWSEQQWSDLLARRGVRSWTAHVGVEAIGLVQLEIHPGHDVEIIKLDWFQSSSAGNSAAIYSPWPPGSPGAWVEPTACGCTPPRSIIRMPCTTTAAGGFASFKWCTDPARCHGELPNSAAPPNLLLSL
ncbi:MAG: hypothetical protein M3332_05285 [Actinomycetota bacterium]|nr:hypothetical protein [Actinomycetota bacterium]